MSELPIYNVLPEIKRTLGETNNTVLIAPPGAGKTTGVPLALLNASWLENRKIIMLEPRRLAAKNAATWMAHQLGEAVGESVGYRMRLDTRVSKKTKIEVITEGILTRIIQNDIALEDYGLVIFDEYHERSLNADLGLALTLDIQQQLRPTLRILVMSATLEGQLVSTLLGNAPVIKSEGRSYPVDIRYADSGGFQQIEQNTLRAVMAAVLNDSGSILVFLPGVAEIRKMYDLLRDKLKESNIAIYPLYSVLSQNEQEKAISPCAAGQRKIVLATSIAETSLTIDGIGVVIDAGLVRQPSFDPRNGLTALETVRVSKASAEQRTGRAGRTGPGVCYRLWTQAEQARLITHNQVEINHADLTTLALELAQWGASDADQLAWLDSPPRSAFTQSKKLLKLLGALDDSESVTAQGLAMLRLGLHPRLSHMVLKSQSLGFGALACDIAAILNERDYFLFSRGEFNNDFSTRVEHLRQSHSNQFKIDRTIKQRILKHSNDLQRLLDIADEGKSQLQYLGVVLAFAYPDRVAKRRKNSANRYQLSNGIGAHLNIEDSFAASEFLVVANLASSNHSNPFNEARIFLAAEISKQKMEHYLSDLIDEVDLIEWDKTTRSVNAHRLRCVGQLVLDRQVLIQPDTECVTKALISGIRQAGIDCLPWSKPARIWQQQLIFLQRTRAKENWPNVCDEYLLEHLEMWLQPFLSGFSRLDQLRTLNMLDILSSLLDWKSQQLMESYAPSRFKVPSGSYIAIDYQQPESPVLAVRIQELFGLENTPVINGGQTNLVLHLLSPAKRPIQVTKDLRNFWDNTYSDVKKELKGRYPKHFWPDDPRTAIATSRIKNKR